MASKLLEKDIQMAICEYLSLKKQFFWRSNTAGLFDPTKKVFRAMPKYGMRGVPDIIWIRDGRFVGLEVKRPKGKQSEGQKEFEHGILQAGGEYHLVTSVDDVMKMV